MKAYPSYKNSGVPWLGHVPEHWDLKRNKVFFSERKEIVGDRHSEHKLLSLTLNGIILRDLENAKGKFPADFSTYQTVHPNDFVFCFFDVDETPRTVGLSTLSGMITGAYTVLSPKNINKKFLYYYYLCIDNRKGLRPLYKGLRKTVPFDAFMASKLPVPPQDEQQQISRYLDWKTSKTNKFIKAKKKLIVLLKEQKRNIINEAVTKGINPDVKMKDSGVEWLGEIPAHWEVRKLKYCVTNKNIQTDSCAKNEIYLALEHIEGWTGKISVSTEKTEFDSKVKKYNAGDILFGKLRPYLAKVAHPYFNGVCVGEFLVLQPKKIIKSHFLSVLLRSKKIIDLINSSTFGAKMPRADWGFIGSIFIPLPPNGEQQVIVEYIEKETALIDKTIARTEKEIELSQEYRTRLVSDVVTGKVDIRSVEIPDFEPIEAELEVQDDEESEGELVPEDTK